jgi:DNA-binding transcriptional ArsR family regulator
VNVIFVEPFFPRNQREFVRGLAEVGATVIGIGETPLDAMDDDLKGWMHHYEQVPSVTDVERMTEVVRWVQSKLWVDRLEATVEAHTLPAAHVREACSIPGTSVRTAWLCRDKPSMKEVLREAGLVHERREGRLRLYRADPAPLAELRGWLDAYWAERRDGLRALAEEEGAR